jgi:hypothetical protein
MHEREPRQADAPDARSKLVRQLLAGCGSGVLTKTSVAPIERLKGAEHGERWHGGVALCGSSLTPSALQSWSRHRA